MTPSIVKFLEARLAEDQEAANKAVAVSSPRWIDNGSLLMYIDDSPTPFAECLASVDNYMQDDSLGHIARHDPARVLREVAAKRRVMERHQPWHGGDSLCEGCGLGGGEYGDEYQTEDMNNCPELRDLASAWSDHPDYRKEWAT